MQALDSGVPTLTKPGYAMIFRRLYRTLLDDYDHHDCNALIEEDWQSDARGGDVLTRESFCDSMFEVAHL